MKKLTDEEIQRLVEEGMKKPSVQISADNDEDQKLYTFLFEELGRKPAVGLSPHFSGKVVEKIQARKEFKRTLSYYGFIIGFILSCLVSMGATIAYMDADVGRNIMTQLIEYKWTILFGIGIFFIIQFLDQILVKNKWLKT